MFEKNQLEDPVESVISDAYKKLQSILETHPFIIIIGKYDHTLGPRAIYSSVNLEIEQSFIRNLLRDALNTKNKFVILNFNYFYSQIYKIEVEDYNARGKKQLYALIFLRHVEFPLIPIIHFKRIEMLFHKIGNDRILIDNKEAFQKFFEEINNIYIKKDELLPLESVNLQIRSGINTIQGFCELILEEKKTNGNISESTVLSYIEIILESCNDVIKALDKPILTTSK